MEKTEGRCIIRAKKQNSVDFNVVRVFYLLYHADSGMVSVFKTENGHDHLDEITRGINGNVTKMH